MAIAFDLVAQRTNHLTVTGIATFPHIDVAASKLERGVGAHALHLLDRALEIEQWCDLDEPADGHHHQDAHSQQQ